MPGYGEPWRKEDNILLSGSKFLACHLVDLESHDFKKMSYQAVRAGLPLDQGEVTEAE